MSAFFFCVILESPGGGDSIVSGRMESLDMLAAVRQIENLYPNALEIQVRKFNSKTSQENDILVPLVGAGIC